jgi:hypothetical protein
MLHQYKDGSELARTIKEMKARRQEEYMSEWQRSELQRLESQAAEFPFSQSRYE